ncbi:MAG: trypsin-like serine protease [SAR202 cluster bacterium]|nr:trypsin-like serine protease [SAR202 cluster bacterium]
MRSIAASRRLQPVAFVGLLLALSLLAAIACGTASAAADTSAADAAIVQPVSNQAAAGIQTAPLSLPDDGAPSLQAAEDLDADAVVAAQESVLGRIYRESLPSVVNVRISVKVAPRYGSRVLPADQYRSNGEGTGFVWSADGHIVTNNHVVQNADKVVVVFADGTEADATVVGTDPDSDLAVLKVSLPADHLKPLPLGESAGLSVGQLVAAIGNPFSQHFTMTSGIISALGRTVNSGIGAYSITGVIQTDASMNPGNSGGPLLDRQGRVIGINTQIVSNTGSSVGIGFAIPVDTAKRVVPAIIAKGRVEYAYLGISGTTLTRQLAKAMALPTETRGVLVAKVVTGGPAEKAGLKGSDKVVTVESIRTTVGGDVITAINGAAVKVMDDLLAFLSRATPGEKITLSVLHANGTSASIEVTLGSRP